MCFLRMLIHIFHANSNTVSLIFVVMCFSVQLFAKRNKATQHPLLLLKISVIRVACVLNWIKLIRNFEISNKQFWHVRLHWLDKRNTYRYYDIVANCTSHQYVIKYEIDWCTQCMRIRRTWKTFQKAIWDYFVWIRNEENLSY